MSYSYESYFGPASEPINIGAFVQSTHVETQPQPTGGYVCRTSSASIAGFDILSKLPEEYRTSLSAECRYVSSGPRQWCLIWRCWHQTSVADVVSPVEEVLNNPALYAHVTKTHETNVYIVHEHADASRRRKRRRPGILDPASESPIVTNLQRKLDNIQLKCRPYVPSPPLEKMVSNSL